MHRGVTFPERQRAGVVLKFAQILIPLLAAIVSGTIRNNQAAKKYNYDWSPALASFQSCIERGEKMINPYICLSLHAR
jgi:hypothetical protein